ncbi:hypothetical protein Zmor_003123 [Zophobas morio]|uniref:V-type proton ATPase subunit S1 n=1 Tax=Zophobas morio TaxID=2755281 RepID=A0AA38M187_9CUCU|nr:hypothetical protein Zmor_003123 [Zophobas morio]
MAYHNYFLIFLIAVFNSNLAQCAEFLPVFMWGTSKMPEHVPALHKISQDSFKDTLLEYLKRDPYILVFTEKNLSPEDFVQSDQNGVPVFTNIQQLKNEGNHVRYLPSVQNPLGAIKQVNKPITQISISSILSSTNVPKDNIWIIDLDDAKDDESRSHMLKRHDFDIVAIYKGVLKHHDNVLVLYTANHTAWVAPDDVTHGRSRNLLESDDTSADSTSPVVFNTTDTLLYLSYDGAVWTGEQIVNVSKAFKLTGASNDGNVSLKLTNDKVTIEILVTQKQGYWYVNNITVDGHNLVVGANIYAPVGFSYHCTTSNFTTKPDTAGKVDAFLTLPGFQIQTFMNNTESFGDAYDCVGFTSIPIWSGLFVTAILLFIITFGLTMMMDIKTMDRFDDPKGKTITVTASE